jgi:TolA-binding protein
VTRAQTLRRLAADPRWLATITVAVMVALVVALTISAVQRANVAETQARDALAAREQTATAASRRIDLMQAQITELQTQLLNGQTTAAAERGDLLARIDALSEQITALGGKPIVTAPATTATTRSTTSTTAARADPTTTRPPASPTPSTPASTTTTRRCVAGVCIGGKNP